MRDEILIGPEIGQTKLSAGLDYYKPTMSQLEYLGHQHEQVTFTFKNRGDQYLPQYVDPAELQAQLERFQHGWQEDELAFLATQERRDGNKLFSENFLNALRENGLPPVDISLDDNGGLSITASGDWYQVTFWETVVMSEINELYFENLVREQGLDIEAVYEEGDRRLSEKIAILQARPDIKFADFGTRRRFSYRWHKHVLGRLVEECPDNLIGTSNTWLAHEFGLMPIGTYAHELPMVYAALADKAGRDPLEGHREMLEDWKFFYDNNLSTALTDTFTSEYFFADFTPSEAEHWAALRHDSGDPFEFGNEVIEFYKELGIDPLGKTIVFSDGLDIGMIIRLADHFAGKINVVFGWGTTLTNDLGIDALNVVMKATEVNGTETVKLSDNEGKHTGSEENVERYERSVRNFCRAKLLRKSVRPMLQGVN